MAVVAASSCYEPAQCHAWLLSLLAVCRQPSSVCPFTGPLPPQRPCLEEEQVVAIRGSATLHLIVYLLT
jgi:hypothetical protein